jgi:transcriptional regulator with XRE-family HTH domain
MAVSNGNSIRPFAELVTARKQELGISFRDLARLTRELDEDGRGLSSAYLVQLFNGNEDPVPRGIRLIARAIGLAPEDFVEYRLHEVREALDERVDFDRAVANLQALGPLAPGSLNSGRASHLPGRRRQAASR